MNTSAISDAQRQALEKTIARLERIIEMIRLAPGDEWLEKFEQDLEWARELRDGEPVRQELFDLSASIMSVYRGAGSFNDWAPGVYDPGSGRYAIPAGAEGFGQAASDLYDAARELRESNPGA